MTIYELCSPCKMVTTDNSEIWLDSGSLVTPADNDRYTAYAPYQGGAWAEVIEGVTGVLEDPDLFDVTEDYQIEGEA